MVKTHYDLEAPPGYEPSPSAPARPPRQERHSIGGSLAPYQPIYLLATAYARNDHQGHFHPPAKSPSAFKPPVRICSISVSSSDKLLVINASPVLISLIQQGIEATWGPVQRIRNRNESKWTSHEFKISGAPWSPYGAKTEVQSARLMLKVLKTMAMFGWNLVQSASMTRYRGEQDTLVSCLQEEEQMLTYDDQGRALYLPVVNSVELFIISFEKVNRIRVINGSSEVLQLIKNVITTHLDVGLEHEEIQQEYVEFRLEDTPFTDDGIQSIPFKVMLSRLHESLQNEEAFKLYGSISARKPQGLKAMDMWVFRRVGPAWS